VVLPRYDLVKYLEIIQKFKATTLHCVPPIVQALATNSLVRKYDLSSVGSIFSISTHLSDETEQQVRKTLPGVVVRQAFGMTEVGCVVANPYTRQKPGSVGILLPNAEAKIVDIDTGKLLGYNQVGELCFRSPTLLTAYFNRPEEPIIDEEGFYHTGDVARIDEDGYGFIVDRLKELIKYKGYQIAPAELEAVLLQHPHVLDAAVVGKRDLISKEELAVAFVVLKPNTSVSKKEISDFVAKRVAPYKHLRGGVILIESIPKSPSGKILRRFLRDKLNESAKL